MQRSPALIPQIPNGEVPKDGRGPSSSHFAIELWWAAFPQPPPLAERAKKGNKATTWLQAMGQSRSMRKAICVPKGALGTVFPGFIFLFKPNSSVAESAFLGV